LNKPRREASYHPAESMLDDHISRSKLRGAPATSFANRRSWQ
jgi:hypothetical protein